MHYLEIKHLTMSYLDESIYCHFILVIERNNHEK